MDLEKLMQQAQDMQAEMERSNQERSQKNYKSSVGGGSIQVSINGEFQVNTITIDPSLLSSEHKGMVEEMLQLALNDALAQANKDKEQSMASLGQGIDLNGMF